MPLEASAPRSLPRYLPTPLPSAHLRLACPDHACDAPTRVGDPANPLEMIRQVAKPEDYVLLKIDIDNTPVEMEFVHRILRDANVSSLIDEMFFEHHVNFQVRRHAHPSGTSQQQQRRRRPQLQRKTSRRSFASSLSPLASLAHITPCDILLVRAFLGQAVR